LAPHPELEPCNRMRDAGPNPHPAAWPESSALFDNA
jgi:hypothetical protein